MLTARCGPPSIQATKAPQRSPVELPLLSHQVSTRLAVNATGTVHPDHGRAILGCGLYLIYGQVLPDRALHPAIRDILSLAAAGLFRAGTEAGRIIAGRQAVSSSAAGPDVWGLIGGDQ